MKTKFIKLNHQWNADPNCPEPKISVRGSVLELNFGMRAYPRSKKQENGHLLFKNCWRYRLGETNDHGWALGQCRFSKVAPEWGDFYELRGDLKLSESPDDWVKIGNPTTSSKHFLFYFRDETFECDADEWSWRQLNWFQRCGLWNV